MSKPVLSPWFETKRDGPPPRLGVYEGKVVTLSSKSNALDGNYFNWNGSEWKLIGNEVSCVPENEVEVLSWRGVIPDKNYPFEKFHIDPELPEILGIISAVHHSEWWSYSEDYGLAATTKLILAEIIEYVESLRDYVRQIDAMCDVDVSLDDLLSALYDANSEDLLQASDELDQPVDEKSRKMDEIEYVEQVKMEVHSFFDLLDLVEIDLPSDDDFDDFDEEAKFIARKTRKFIGNVSRLMEMLWEG